MAKENSIKVYDNSIVNGEKIAGVRGQRFLPANIYKRFPIEDLCRDKELQKEYREWWMKTVHDVYKDDPMRFLGQKLIGVYFEGAREGGMIIFVGTVINSLWPEEKGGVRLTCPSPCYRDNQVDSTYQFFVTNDCIDPTQCFLDQSIHGRQMFIYCLI